MRIVFVGAGNLATNLAKALYKKGNDIVQVFSRTSESAESLAEQVNSLPTTDLKDIVGDADLYIMSLKDSVLKDIVKVLCSADNNGLFVHTAGSIPMEIFSGYARRYGVLYPMQSFSKQHEVDFHDVPFFVEANTAGDCQLLKELASTLSERVFELSSEARKHLHLAAVFASNFANHCYELCGEILHKYGIPFDVMLPLIDEIARKVHYINPREAQTGPAIRYDENVIDMQKKLLAYDPRLLEIYKVMSESIHTVAITKNENL